MSAVAVVFMVFAWLALGWLGARLHLISWHDQFGDYEDAIGLAVAATLMGPLGLIVGVASYISDRRTPSRNAGFWGLR